MSTPSENLESTATEALESLQESCSQCCEDFAEKIRQSPITSVLIAAVVGYFLRFVPVLSISGALGRVLFTLAKPALIILGLLSIAKMCPCRKAAGTSGEESGGSEPLVDSPAGPS